MTQVQFGFIVFEKCFHCNHVRTYFTEENIVVIGDEYREDDHFWLRVENAQSFRFNLKCSACGAVERFDDLMGLLYCTACRPDCRIEIQRKRLEKNRTFLILASGFLKESAAKPQQLSAQKLGALEEYYNRRRNTSRSRIAIVPFDLEDGFSACKAEFLHDVGMLSPEPVTDRKAPF
jgi:hypothetical protein